GAFFLHHEPKLLIESLIDSLTVNRIEIDMIEFSGIEFRHVDNRLMSLKLVQLGLSKAAMFGPTGAVLQPSEVLYKKCILVERGSFRPVCNVNVDMLHAAYQVFSEEPEVKGEPILQLAELSMRNLIAGDGNIDTRDFLARADLLCANGMTVLISDYFEYYRLRAYLNNFTKQKVGIVMGIPSLLDIFDEKYYLNLEGGILESFGRLFKNNVKLYVYPYLDPLSKIFITTENAPISPETKKLYDYLMERGNIYQLTNHDPSCLQIFSRDILKRIKNKDSSWEKMVSPQVADMIKNRHYFGYQGQ
ncbi:MAG: TonB-dependent receptor, partial [Verrucomicrobiota bacterium]